MKLEKCVNIEAEELRPNASKDVLVDNVSADPWLYLIEFVTFVKTDGLETFVYKCKLCSSSKRNISLKRKSRWNLINPIQAMHFHAFENFEKACQIGSKKKNISGKANKSKETILFVPSPSSAVRQK